MDFEEPIQTPLMTTKNSADIVDWQQCARGAEHVLGTEKTKHERTKQASRRLQAQLDIFVESDLWARQRIQTLTNSSVALSQEVLRLRCVVDTLNGVLRMICDHSTCGNAYKGENLQAQD